MKIRDITMRVDASKPELIEVSIFDDDGKATAMTLNRLEGLMVGTLLAGLGEQYVDGAPEEDRARMCAELRRVADSVRINGLSVEQAERLTNEQRDRAEEEGNFIIRAAPDQPTDQPTDQP